MLVTQAALYGTFTAQSFILWFVFYEMSLIPAFLLIKVWGGENRERASTKFFLYTFLGSVAMLLAFLGIYFSKATFDFRTLVSFGNSRRYSPAMSAGLFSPEFFSGWPSRCRCFLSTPGCRTRTKPLRLESSMVLTGMLSKMGIYGFVRLLVPIFPNKSESPGLGCLRWLFARFVFARWPRGRKGI